MLERPQSKGNNEKIVKRTSAPFPGIRICRMRRQRTNIFPDNSGMTGELFPPPIASRGMYREIPWRKGYEDARALNQNR